MNLRFTSTLTREDENLMAEGLMKALVGFLDLLPIAYSLRIDTSDAHVLEHSSLAAGGDEHGASFSEPSSDESPPNPGPKPTGRTNGKV